MTTITEVTRTFTYAGMNLVDPDPTMSAENVLNFFANLYPELNQGTVAGGEIKNGVQSYTFEVVAGTKGRSMEEEVCDYAEMAYAQSLDMAQYEKVDIHLTQLLFELGDAAPSPTDYFNGSFSSVVLP